MSVEGPERFTGGPAALCLGAISCVRQSTVLPEGAEVFGFTRAVVAGLPLNPGPARGAPPVPAGIDT